MTTAFRSITLMAACIMCAAVAGAQTPTPSTGTTQTTSSQASDESTRPATTTFFGDTGLWFVPTAEVLPNGKWSVSAYRRGTNWIPGYTNVGDFAGTFGIGIKDRAEIFGSFLFDTRIDRDTYPLFVPSDATIGGIIDRYPRVNQHWTGDNVGDFYLGAKFNLWSEYRQKPAAFAIRALLKVPTGKPDLGWDVIVSKEAAKLVEVSGYGGYQFRGSPDGLDLPTGAFHWGAGVTFPSRNFLRV